MKQSLLCYFRRFPSAVLAEIVLDRLWQDELLEAFLQITDVFDFQCQMIKILNFLFLLVTLATSNFTNSLPLKRALKLFKLLLTIPLKNLLNNKEDLIKKLVSILLKWRINRLVIIILDGQAKLPRIVIFLLTFTEINIHFLQLVEEIVDDWNVVDEDWWLHLAG